MGQDEQAATPVACASFSRREQARLCPETHFAKAAGDVGKSQIDVTFDVFAENPFGFGFADDPGDLGPEMTGIGLASPLSGLAEGLAGITGRDEMYAAAPRAAVEGSQIVPYRRRSQGRVFHPGHESGRRMGFALDVTHSPISGFGDVQAEVEAGIASAQGDAAQLGVICCWGT